MVVPSRFMQSAQAKAVGQSNNTQAGSIAAHAVCSSLRRVAWPVVVVCLTHPFCFLSLLAFASPFAHQLLALSPMMQQRVSPRVVLPHRAAPLPPRHPVDADRSIRPLEAAAAALVPARAVDRPRSWHRCRRLQRHTWRLCRAPWPLFLQLVLPLPVPWPLPPPPLPRRRCR